MEKRVDLNEILTTKMRQLEEIKTKINEVSAARDNLIQQGIELQGAVRQINELIGLEKGKSSPTGVPISNELPNG